jgi:DNA-binding transcriptional regulator LsrR (DeoR family)
MFSRVGSVGDVTEKLGLSRSVAGSLHKRAVEEGLLDVSVI